MRVLVRCWCDVKCWCDLESSSLSPFHASYTHTPSNPNPSNRNRNRNRSNRNRNLSTHHQGRSTRHGDRRNAIASDHHEPRVAVRCETLSIICYSLSVIRHPSSAIRYPLFIWRELVHVAMIRSQQNINGSQINATCHMAYESECKHSRTSIPTSLRSS